MVKRTGGTIAIVLMIAGAASAAQEPQPSAQSAPGTQAQPPSTTQPTAPLSPPPNAPDTRVERAPQPPLTVAPRPLTPAALRRQMVNFAGALRQAVQTGAANMDQKVRQVSPGAGLVLSGPAEVTSFRMTTGSAEIGPVFDVRVPDITANTSWAIASRLAGSAAAEIAARSTARCTLRRSW